VNSAGLTDFNPDLRLALSTNADSVLHLVEFLRRCRRAGLVHVSTCFVNGRTDGRVPEELQPSYTPRGASDFNARREWEFLHSEVNRIEQEADGPVLQSQFRSEAQSKVKSSADGSDEKAVNNQIRKIRTALGSGPLDRHWDRASPTLGLAKYLHLYEEPGRVVARSGSGQSASEYCPAVDRGVFSEPAVSWLE
jgi:hypothetical protein